MFRGEHSLVHFSPSLVDEGFAWVEAINETDNPLVIERKARLGTLYKADFASACYVSTGADWGYTDNGVGVLDSMDTEAMVAETMVAEMMVADRETTLSNRVTIYGSPEVVSKLTTVVTLYPVWGERTGFVDVPEERWMTIPLIDGWETKLPKSKIYPVGPKGRQLIDETFDRL